MYKVIAVYRAPSDEAKKAERDEYFKNVHTPISLKIPGIVNKVFGRPMKFAGDLVSVHFAEEQIVKA